MQEYDKTSYPRMLCNEGWQTNTGSGILANKEIRFLNQQMAQMTCMLRNTDNKDYKRICLIFLSTMGLESTKISAPHARTQ